jgi:aminoglycoside 3-N-acetyltransferase
MPGQSYIPYLDIADHLHLQSSDVLIIASDITRLAFQAKRHEGGFDINAFIDSFRNKLGPQGTLILPAYNFMLRSGQVFDPVKTAPATGALPLAAFRRDDFMRTWHPLHSFLVWGEKAQELAALRNISSFGKDSPFAKFLEWDANMLFIGSDVSEAFTYVHHVEEVLQVGYRHYKKLRIPYHDDGKFQGMEQILFYKKRWGWTMNLDLLQDNVLSGTLDIMKINNVECSLLNIKKADLAIRQDILENQARNIAHYNTKLFLRDMTKSFLTYFHIYKTTQDKINDGTGLQ